MKKKLTYLILGVVAIAGSACKKDSTETTNKKNIVGKWYVSKIKTKLYKNSAEISSDSTSYSNKTAYIQFNADVSGRTQDGDNGYGFNYSISGSNITLSNLSFTNNTDIEVDKIPLTLEISALSSNSLQLHSETSYKILSDSYKEVQDTYLGK